jgi:hypothetical protein
MRGEERIEKVGGSELLPHAGRYRGTSQCRSTTVLHTGGAEENVRKQRPSIRFHQLLLRVRRRTEGTGAITLLNY